MKRIAVIMAGGSGERFYPLSRSTRPKQMLPLVRPDQTMIEQSIARVLPLIPAEDIFIITSVALQAGMRELLTSLPPKNIIAEPSKRNTAPCLALAAAVAIARYTGRYDASHVSIAVLTADQFIKNEDAFRRQVDEAMSYAEQNTTIVTLGITPSRPETGYGYIQSAGALQLSIRAAKAFHEKPDVATAMKYKESGDFFWNSGMFFYRCDTFVDGMKKHAPSIGNEIVSMQSIVSSQQGSAVKGTYEGLSSLYNTLPDISIDYALMEKADNVAILPSEFEWDDVGSWDALDRSNEHDSQNNVTIGPCTTVDAQNSILANYSSDQRMMLSVVGLDNVVAVVTDDSVLICAKDKVQDIKKAVALMKERQQSKWL